MDARMNELQFVPPVFRPQSTGERIFLCKIVINVTIALCYFNYFSVISKLFHVDI